jgi:hypothetical protein
MNILSFIPRMAEFTEIIVDKLFLGNVRCVTEKKVLNILDINIIISILSEDEYERFGVTRDCIGDREWCRLILEDDEDEKIGDYFTEVRRIIKEGIEKEKTVLVHCAAGISRSPSFIIAYLMRENGWDYEKAYRYVKDRRPYIRPNSGFEKQLKNI